MNGIQQWLQIFHYVSCFYRYMLMIPLWNKYPNYQNSIIDSLAIFLEGYAFERQGRRPDYFHAAVDSLIACNNNLTPHCVWNNFRQRLNNQRLNHRNNPIYPSSNPDNIRNINNKMSVIEVVSSFQNRVTLSQGIYNLIIQNQDITQSFNLLRRIRGIGNKIASFYLRDLVVVLNINLINIQNRWLLQPIDIWVERIVQYLARNRNISRTQVASWIVTNSLNYSLNPEYINMGMWFYCSIIVTSEYRLNRSLHNINMAQSLISDFRSRINNVCQNC